MTNSDRLVSLIEAYSRAHRVRHLRPYTWDRPWCLAKSLRRILRTDTGRAAARTVRP